VPGFTQPAVLSEPAFPLTCQGTISQTKAGVDLSEFQTYEVTLSEGEADVCPLTVQIDESKQNRVHSANGFIHYGGQSAFGLELNAENGNIVVYP
jgi:hypothetical protein